MLAEAQWHRLERLAGRVASSPHFSSSPAWGRAERFDAALDALAEWLDRYGWPQDDSLLPAYEFAHAAVRTAARRWGKHMAWASYWVEPPGSADALAEAITDRIGIRQLCHALTADQWAATWATAEVMLRDGTREDAAALLGWEPARLTYTLHRARAKARALWVAAGDTPPGRYAPNRRGGPRNKMRTRHANDQRRQRRKLAEEAS